jgi:hypothetical protein
MKKQLVRASLLLLLCLGLSTSMNAFKIYNSSGRTLTIGIEYKTLLGKNRPKVVGQVASGNHVTLKPGSFRRSHAIFWTEEAVKGVSYRLEFKKGELGNRFDIMPGGSYTSGSKSGKALRQE